MSFTPDGKLLVVDVGQVTWEEVDLVTAGANYGWPRRRPLQRHRRNQLWNTFPVYQPDLCLPPYTPGGSSITGVMVYTGPGSAAAPQHTVLIADFNKDWVQQLTCASDYSSCDNPTTFTGAAAGGTNKLAQGPDGGRLSTAIGRGPACAPHSIRWDPGLTAAATGTKQWGTEGTVPAIARLKPDFRA